MIKYTAGFVDKLENILSESGYRVRYERGNFQSGWCLLDHKSVVVLNKFLNVEGRVNTLVDLIPQLKIDFDKLTLASQKVYDFLTANHLKEAKENAATDTDASIPEATLPAEDQSLQEELKEEQREIDDDVSNADGGSESATHFDADAARGEDEKTEKE